MSEWVEYIIETVEQWVRDGILTASQAGHFYLNLAKSLDSKPRENK